MIGKCQKDLTTRTESLLEWKKRFKPKEFNRNSNENLSIYAHTWTHYPLFLVPTTTFE